MNARNVYCCITCENVFDMTSNKPVPHWGENPVANISKRCPDCKANREVRKLDFKP